MLSICGVRWELICISQQVNVSFAKMHFAGFRDRALGIMHLAPSNKNVCLLKRTRAFRCVGTHIILGTLLEKGPEIDAKGLDPLPKPLQPCP